MDTFTVVSALALFVLAIIFMNCRKWNGNLPPGPMHFPLIGNMLQLAGKDLRQVCEKYRKTYGDVFTLRVFNKTLIVVNGFDNIKDMCVRNGDVFSERHAVSTLDFAFGGKDDELVRIMFELFATGTETTSTTLRFALLFMLRNPEVQERLASELRNVVPEHRLPDIDDFKKVPYLQATISEILRRSGVAPFSLPHAAKTDSSFLGYTIPKSAGILMNLQSVLLDESLWEDPLDFNPSRFMKETTSQTKMEEFIPFGIGPRSCPGESLARMELSLFLPAMLHRFKFVPPEGEGPPSLASKPGVTATPLPFKLRAIRRL